MIEFLVALCAFVVAHLVPALPGVRARLVGQVGRTAYLVAYSASSLALLAWVVVAARRADDVTLWEPAAWQWALPALAMPVALFLIVAGLAEGNPLSVSLRKADDGRLPAIAAVTRHPVLWGFLLWAVAHIPANGRVVPVILFGAMAAMAAAGMPMLDRKVRRRMGPAAWSRLAAQASCVPLRALATRRASRPALAPLAGAATAAILLYAWVLLQGHALLIGPDPLAGLRAFL
jgi:uncharacterized membrane protein